MIIWTNFPQPKNGRFLLLDRDGILNEDRPDYVKNFREIVFYPDTLEALRLLKLNDVGVILVSNQSGVNRGLIHWDDFWAIHEGVIRQVEEHGGNIVATFYCPHRPDEQCECRKPGPAMIFAACRFAGIEPDHTYFIGDKESDMKAARNAGCPGIRVCRGENSRQSDMGPSEEPYFTTMLDAVLSIYGDMIRK